MISKQIFEMVNAPHRAASSFYNIRENTKIVCIHSFTCTTVYIASY